MTFEALSVVAMMCANPDFNTQNNCQKKILNCLEVLYHEARPELMAFGISQCIRNERRGPFSKLFR